MIKDGTALLIERNMELTESNILVPEGSVDKKYIIATNIVNCLINPPYFQPEKTSEDEKMLHLILMVYFTTEKLMQMV